MESSEFDKALQGKLQGETHLYRQEIDQAKLALWSQVDENLQTNGKSGWYWLVAAAVLLLITFSSVIFSIKENHKHELGRLSAELAQTKKQYAVQSTSLEINKAELAILTNKLAQKKEGPKVQIIHQTPIIEERIIHRIDTVYITEVQYLAVDSSETTKEFDDLAASQEDDKWVVPASTTPTFIAIATSPSSNNKNESLKVKFGSFTKKLINQ